MQFLGFNLTTTWNATWLRKIGSAWSGKISQRTRTRVCCIFQALVLSMETDGLGKFTKCASSKLNWDQRISIGEAQIRPFYGRTINYWQDYYQQIVHSDRSGRKDQVPMGRVSFGKLFGVFRTVPNYQDYTKLMGTLPPNTRRQKTRDNVKWSLLRVMLWDEASTK